MNVSKVIMGRAANIAHKAMFDEKGLNIEPHYVFTESEFKRFAQCYAAEQRAICAQAAREAVAHPFAEAVFAGDVVQCCDTPELF